MSKVKIIIAAFVAVLALTAVAAGSASAHEWFVNGAALVGSQKLSTLATNDTPAVLNVPGLPLKITCTGDLEGVGPKIEATSTGSATSLTFTGCAVTTPTSCKLSSPEIKTEEVTAAVTLASGTADHILFKATTAKHFTEFVLESTSENCSISGKKAVTGTVVLNSAKGQIESSIQALEGLGSLEQGSDSLQTANDPAYIEGGKALLQLESGAKWSFH